MSASSAQRLDSSTERLFCSLLFLGRVRTRKPAPSVLISLAHHSDLGKVPVMGLLLVHACCAHWVDVEPAFRGPQGWRARETASWETRAVWFTGLAHKAKSPKEGSRTLGSRGLEKSKPPTGRCKLILYPLTMGCLTKFDQSQTTRIFSFVDSVCCNYFTIVAAIDEKYINGSGQKCATIQLYAWLPTFEYQP